MKSRELVLLLAILSPLVAYSQASAPIDKDAFAQHANSLYYRPAEAGLVSFTCRVNVDWNTVPSQILLPAEIAGRKPLEETKFLAAVHSSGTPSTRQEYAHDAPAWMKPAYDRLFTVLSSLVSGFLQSWETKYLHGAMPEERFVTGVDRTSDGYQVTAATRPAQRTFTVASDYRVREIATKGPNGDIDEHTVFSDSPQGFVLTSNDATTRQNEDTTQVRYDLTYQMADGFRLPDAVDLKVNDNIDMKFSFDHCSAQKGEVIAVRPPSAGDRTKHHN